jgi:hypothetical protein
MQADMVWQEFQGCIGDPACAHIIWDRSELRCRDCPHRRSNFDMLIVVPLGDTLKRCRTRFGMAIAFARSCPTLAAHHLSAKIEATFLMANAIVIDADGIEIDLCRTEVRALFGCTNWNRRFQTGRLPCAWGDDEPIRTHTRVKLLWIALALIDREAAHDVLI